MGELSFRVDRSHHHSLTEQVERGLRHAILTAVYAPGDCLPTLLEMAAQLGVSEIVVRRAVRRLSDEGLVKGRTRSGIRVCDFRRLPWRAHVLYLHLSGANMYYHSVLSATMSERLQENRVLVTRSHLSAADAMHDFGKVQALLDTQPPGLVVVEGTSDGPEHLLGGRGIPFLHFYENPSPRAAGHIGPRSGTTMRAVADHCRLCGVRTVLLVMASAPSAGLRSLLGAAGIDCKALTVPPVTELGVPAAVEAGALRAVTQYLAEGQPLPVLIYFGDDFAARGALQAMTSRGIRIPDDVQVISWANRGLGPVFAKPLTRVEMEPEAHGAAVANAILAQLDHADGDPPVDVALEPVFIVGGTTRHAG